MNLVNFVRHVHGEELSFASTTFFGAKALNHQFGTKILLAKTENFSYDSFGIKQDLMDYKAYSNSMD